MTFALCPLTPEVLGTLRWALLPLAALKALLNALQLQAAARRLAAIDIRDRKSR